MSQVEGQRAIIEGSVAGAANRIYEVRARIVPAIPAKASVLQIDRAELFLRGYWHEKGYQGFGLAPIPMGAENTFTPNLEPEPGDDPELLKRVAWPRVLILEDQKVFRPNAYMGPDASIAALEQQYQERVFGHPSFDFEAMWERVGRRQTS
jgi:hypothetical protein